MSLHVLVVDDEPATVNAMRMLLAGDGHTVTTCTSVGDAIAALSRGSFDAVITDLEMADGDGCAVVVASPKAVAMRTRLMEARACILADKPLDYDAVAEAVAPCRARGRPADGSCRLGPRGGLVQLR